MPPLDSLLELDGGNTSHLCCASCTGFQSRLQLTLNLHVLSSRLCLAPSYLSDNIHLVSEGPRRRLRSSTDCVLFHAHTTHSVTSFAVAGPHVWNRLPGHLRDENITYSSFRRELKTYWFSCNRGTI